MSRVERRSARRELPDGRELEADAEVELYRYSGDICASQEMAEIRQITLCLEGEETRLEELYEHFGEAEIKPTIEVLERELLER